MNKKISFKKGVASFYIIIFATLILVVIAASFATIIISEVERTSNDDLAQSAYDSAMAGVEDAKLAYYAYQTCLDNGSGEVNGVGCGNIITQFESASTTCNTTKYILGKTTTGDNGEVIVEEENIGSSDMQQAYTCVKMTDITESYIATLSSNNTSKVIRAKFDGGVTADDISYITVSWYSDSNAGEAALNFGNFDGSKVVFDSEPVTTSESTISTPPVLMVGLVQTGASFKMSDFDTNNNNQTNRGAVYLVPVNSLPDKEGDTYSIATNKEISADALIKSNDKTSENKPYLVSCNPDSSTGYICSAKIYLPEAVGGGRSDDTFTIVVSLPYGQPETDIKVDFNCANGEVCNTVTSEGSSSEEKAHARLSQVQVEIDSTGRANDLYRRVVTYLDNGNEFKISGMGAIEILGTTITSGENASDSGKAGLVKNIYTTREYGL